MGRPVIVGLAMIILVAWCLSSLMGQWQRLYWVSLITLILVFSSSTCLIDFVLIIITGNHLFIDNRFIFMSAVEWIVGELRFAFLDTYSGVVWLLTAYVFIKIAFDAYRDR